MIASTIAAWAALAFPLLPSEVLEQLQNRGRFFCSWHRSVGLVSKRAPALPMCDQMSDDRFEISGQINQWWQYWYDVDAGRAQRLQAEFETAWKAELDSRAAEQYSGRERASSPAVPALTDAERSAQAAEIEAAAVHRKKRIQEELARQRSEELARRRAALRDLSDTHLCDDYASDRSVRAAAEAEIRRRKLISLADWASVSSGEVRIGMTEIAVRCALGPPKAINRTVTSSGERKQLVYNGIYVYVSAGVVVAWQD